MTLDNNYKINEVLKHEYNIKEKPLTSFPEKLIKHLIQIQNLSLIMHFWREG